MILSPLNYIIYLANDNRSEKGFNASQREDPKLMRFMKNLAHFTINSLGDLLSKQGNFFNGEDDYIDVTCILLHKLILLEFTPIFRLLIQVLMKISNRLPQNITISSTNISFLFSPILTDELGLCYTFNSRISPYLSPTWGSRSHSWWKCQLSKSFQISHFRKIRK